MLSITGRYLPSSGAQGGPWLCQKNEDGTPNENECYEPVLQSTQLHITKGASASYKLKAQINGLSGGSSVIISNGADVITETTDGTFTISSNLVSGSTYSASLQTNSTTQTCTPTGLNGTITNQDITIPVICSANVWSIGGEVTGLAMGDTLTLQDIDNNSFVTISGAATNPRAYFFPIKQPQGSTYTVDVQSQPANKTCTVDTINNTNTGTLGTSNVTDVHVTCDPYAYTLGGSVSGLTGTLKLKNGSDELDVIANGSFEFLTKVADTSNYTVSILTQPTGQTCSFVNSSETGTISGADVTNVQVSCVNNTTTLNSNRNLALKVSGNSRIITITNNGLNATTNLSVESADLPNTTATVDPSNCQPTLAAGATCTITISPQANASSDGTNACTDGTSPRAGVIVVDSDNSAPVTTNVFVLDYGCIYQEGFIYSIDDNPANYPLTGSIGGKVVSLSDLEAPYIGSSTTPGPGIVWDADPACGPPTYSCTKKTNAWDILHGQNLPSVAGSSNPNNTDTNGPGNTHQISSVLTLAGHGNTNNPATYAAGVCINFSGGGYTNWYLPAICEMGLASNGSDCVAGTDNMLDNLNLLIGDPNATVPSTSCTHANNCLAGSYWSSTEYSSSPQGVAWFQFFSSGGSGQGYDDKDFQLGVRCSRALSL